MSTKGFMDLIEMAFTPEELDVLDTYLDFAVEDLTELAADDDYAEDDKVVKDLAVAKVLLQRVRQS